MRRNSRFPTKIMLLIRVAIGGYLLYLCYSLYQTRDAGSISPALLAIILAVFVICAIAVIAHSAYLFMNGMYDGEMKIMLQNSHIVLHYASQTDDIWRGLEMLMQYVANHPETDTADLTTNMLSKLVRQCLL